MSSRDQRIWLRDIRARNRMLDARLAREEEIATTAAFARHEIDLER